jgi:hypothetical protein
MSDHAFTIISILIALLAAASPLLHLLQYLRWL